MLGSIHLAATPTHASKPFPVTKNQMLFNYAHCRSREFLQQLGTAPFEESGVHSQRKFVVH